jgi:hypothetical protein
MQASGTVVVTMSSALPAAASSSADFDSLPHLLTMAWYEYVQDGEVTAVTPLVAPVSGGTQLLVEGQGFVPSGGLRCGFGDPGAGEWATAEAAWVSTRILRCVLPRQPSYALLQVSVSNDGATYRNSTSAMTHLEVVADPELSLAAPRAGPAQGGSEVVVLGAHFSSRAAELGYLRCRFNTTAVVATLLNQSAMRCVAPPMTPAASAWSVTSARVPLEVSNNAVDYTNTGMLFEYQSVVVVYGLTPSRGATSGGTLVQVEGEHFVAGGSSECSFGGSVVAATVVTSHLLRCRVPASLTASPVVVEVSANGGADFSSSAVVFTYLLRADVSSLLPEGGPTQGRTLVSVVGSNFLSTPELRCRFGVIEVAATFITSSLLNCTAPAQTAGAVAVEVSTNGVDFSASNITYQYVSEVRVVSLLPNSGPLLGHTNVSVISTSLLPGSSCRFGEVSALRVEWVSHFELVCVSPPQPAGSLSVEVSSNVQDFTADRIAFAYTDRCPSRR